LEEQPQLQQHGTSPIFSGCQLGHMQSKVEIYS
jgi:hypothetical protein